MSKVKLLVIKAWERTEHPTLKTKTELKKMKLMPKYNVKPRALVDRPKKYGGDYYLYDETLTMPYKKSQKQKEEEKKKIKKKKAEYTCVSCKKYLGIKRVKDNEIQMWEHMCKECYFEKYWKYDKEKILCFDIETTGLNCWDDEILQLSIINGNGNILFNQYFKPEHTEIWEDAELVNGITPDMVKNEKTFSFYKEEIQKIFDTHDIIVGYNHASFDIPFLQNNEIQIDNKDIFDVMYVFAKIMGDWDYKKRRYRYSKLVECAAYYKYENQGSFHNALEDVYATLHCFNEIIRSEK